jgi:hypothetical protein
MTTDTPVQRIKIGPNQVFRLVQLLPKDLQAKFTKEAYTDVVHDTAEFVPEPERKYDHPLGLEWLTKHKIPNTVEELEEQRQYVFQTMVSGSDTYNVGQFFVVFPRIVYASNDLKDNLLVVEVMDELEFPPMPDMKVAYTDEMRKANWQDEATIALRAALQSYVVQGKIKIHDAGFRMYSSTDMYQFQERYIDPEAEVLSFKDAVRRHRQSN